VEAAVRSYFPDEASALLGAWRSRQFEYTWLLTAGHQYRDFWRVTDDALVAAARSLRLELRPEQRSALTGAYLSLQAWPDVPETLARLENAGVAVGLLSNFTLTMLESNIAAADLRGAFRYVLSTDQARTFKPAPEAYQLGLNATGLAREQVAFAAFAGWDAAGASWFGYPTVWVNRAGASAEELAAQPGAVGADLAAVADLVLSR
jgi:2-haloacid dehalogenase